MPFSSLLIEDKTECVRQLPRSQRRQVRASGLRLRNVSSRSPGSQFPLLKELKPRVFRGRSKLSPWRLSPAKPHRILSKTCYCVVPSSIWVTGNEGVGRVLAAGESMTSVWPLLCPLCVLGVGWGRVWSLLMTGRLGMAVPQERLLILLRWE